AYKGQHEDFKLDAVAKERLTIAVESHINIYKAGDTITVSLSGEWKAIIQTISIFLQNRTGVREVGCITNVGTSAQYIKSSIVHTEGPQAHNGVYFDVGNHNWSTIHMFKIYGNGSHMINLRIFLNFVYLHNMGFEAARIWNILFYMFQTSFLCIELSIVLLSISVNWSAELSF
ncbi:hypothetical protein ACJX0J_011973, partial [Zea mays]